MTACFATLDNQRIDPGPGKFLRQRQRRCKAHHSCASFLDRFDAALGRQSTGEHDMAHLVFRTDRDQVHNLRVHGDKVHAKWLGCKRLGRSDFGIEQFGRHRPARNHPEPARVRNRGNQVALGHPRHGAAKDGNIATEKFGAAIHEVGEFRHGNLRPPAYAGATNNSNGERINPHQAHKLYAAHVPQAQFRLRRSAPRP